MSPVKSDRCLVFPQDREDIVDLFYTHRPVAPLTSTVTSVPEDLLDCAQSFFFFRLIGE